MTPNAGAMVLARPAWAWLSAAAIPTGLAQPSLGGDRAEIDSNGFEDPGRRFIAVPLAP